MASVYGFTDPSVWQRYHRQPVGDTQHIRGSPVFEHLCRTFPRKESSTCSTTCFNFSSFRTVISSLVFFFLFLLVYFDLHKNVSHIHERAGKFLKGFSGRLCFTCQQWTTEV